jgi:hypothetical protein
MLHVGWDYALERRLQVDECQTAFNAHLLSRSEPGELTNFVAPFTVALSWLSAGHERSSEIYAIYRSAFFLLFAVGLVAIAASQTALRGPGRRWLALLLATTMYPLWHHGIEVRHDVLAALCVVGMYGALQAVRGRGPRVRPLLVAGALAALAQSGTLKAFAYWVPIGGLIILAAYDPERARPVRQRLVAAAWLAAGFLPATLALLGIMAARGQHRVFLAQLHGFLFSRLGDTYDLPVAALIDDLLGHAPLHVGLAVVFLGWLGYRLARRQLRWSSPQVLLGACLLWVTIVLFLNPTPFPYNLLYVAPFLIFAGCEIVALIVDAPNERRIPVGAALGFTAALVFYNGYSAHRTLIWRMDQQTAFMDLAERMTGPADSVLDGVGLVLTRPPPGRDWMLHSLSMRAYRAGEMATFSGYIEGVAPPLAFTNYRWGWLPPGEQRLLRERYLEIYPGFHVLGIEIDPAVQTFTLGRSGRYVARSAQSPPAAEATITVDGRVLVPGAPYELASGAHTVAGQGPWVLHWLGPGLAEPPEVPFLRRYPTLVF